MREQKVYLLINNEGIYQCPYTKTEEGFKMQLGSTTYLLLDLLKRSSPSWWWWSPPSSTSMAASTFEDLNSESSCNKAFCYSQSKLANLLFTRELARCLEDEGITGVTVNALTPGIVRTRLGRHIHIPFLAKPLFYLASLAFFKSPLEGAQKPLYQACLPDVEGVAGKCFANCEEEELMPKATDDHAAKRLWDLSESMVGIKSQ
ncbi:hypothetical protein J4Q44_G00346140 [Coregonus suidteri]|uniref:Retinol dehydrogenase 14 n=1 Tax=Coregonus suidteri TaxID=861788 RepID=A0AAN8KPD4_9TELE